MSTGRSRGRARVRTGAEQPVGGLLEGAAAASGENLPQPPTIPPSITTTAPLPTVPTATRTVIILFSNIF